MILTISITLISNNTTTINNNGNTTSTDNSINHSINNHQTDMNDTEATKYDAFVFGYALGSGADTVAPKRPTSTLITAPMVDAHY